MIVDPLDNVWVGDFAEFDEHPHEWSVFGPRGDFLGTVRPPERFDLMAVGDNSVGAVLRDSLDVEHVVLLPLIKPEKRTR